MALHLDRDHLARLCERLRPWLHLADRHHDAVDEHQLVALCVDLVIERDAVDRWTARVTAMRCRFRIDYTLGRESVARHCAPDGADTQCARSWAPQLPLREVSTSTERLPNR